MSNPVVDIQAVDYPTVEVLVSSEPVVQEISTGPRGEKGPRGLSAYEVAVDGGYSGSEEDWVASLKGEKGDKGLSAYEVAVEGGYSGTQSQWLASLRGAQGVDGRSAYEVAVAQGFVGTEEEWLLSLVGNQGPAGYSAYEVAVQEGFVGSREEWLESLVGPQGVDGDSAYEVAVANGFIGTEQEWLDSLIGPEGADSTVPGPEGLSAYQVAVANGFVGDEAAWLESLQGEPGVDGEDGAPGAPGVGVPVGGAAGQVLGKVSGADFDTAWVDQTGGGSADLPPVGDEGDVLTTVGGVWAAAPSQGGSPARQTTVLTGATGDLTASLAPTAQLVAVEAAGAVRVRLYRSVEQREADRMRHFQSMPEGDAVLADFNFDQADVLWCNPVPILTSVDGNYFILVNGGASDVTLTWERN